MEESPIPTPPIEENVPPPTPPKRYKTAGMGVARMVQTVISVAIVMATLFTFWNPYRIFSSQITILPTPANETHVAETVPIQVGIHVGHYQHNEGFQCPDDIKEVDVNYVIANKVSLLLAASGIMVDVLQEYDLKLINYKADALVSIHTRSCTDPSAAQSGFYIRNSLSSTNVDKANTLAACLGEQYQLNTGLVFQYEPINVQDPSSHIFVDINTQTPAVLIETGSLAVDRGVIVGSSDRAASGITAGILCFLKAQQLMQ